MPHDLPKPFILVILDGWGIAPPGDGNPLSAANTPNIHELMQSFPTTTVRASGEAVGLSWGEQGNSEVGHLTIGAGKIYYQSLPRINMSIQSGEFFKNEKFLKAIEHVKMKNSTLHIMGIMSAGNVHGSNQHTYALLEMAKQHGVKNVMVHAFLDGRDTQFNSGIDYIRELQAKMKEIGVGQIASMSGRYYAMDRDNRWDRVHEAHNAVIAHKSRIVEDPVAEIQTSYARKTYDEEFPPVTIGKNGVPIGPVKDGDGLIFINFRPDRAREITQAFTIPAFNKFERAYMGDLFFVAMTEYEKGTTAHTAFPQEIVETCLARVISDAGLKQLHIAETEKYAHVTFFLNGMREDEYPGEDRVIIPSPHVSTYDQAPEMATPLIAERIVQEVAAGTYDFIVVNFANADMVGHTGKFEETKRGAEVIDQAVGRICAAALPVGGMVAITADHGNGEEVLNLQTGEIDKEHSTNPVPFIIVTERLRGRASPAGEVIGGDLSLMPPVGMLADVAPTVLKVLGVARPPEMTGVPLL